MVWIVHDLISEWDMKKNEGPSPIPSRLRMRFSQVFNFLKLLLVPNKLFCLQSSLAPHLRKANSWAWSICKAISFPPFLFLPADRWKLNTSTLLKKTTMPLCLKYSEMVCSFYFNISFKFTFSSGTGLFIFLCSRLQGPKLQELVIRGHLTVLKFAFIPHFTWKHQSSRGNCIPII